MMKMLLALLKYHKSKNKKNQIKVGLFSMLKSGLILKKTKNITKKGLYMKK